MTATTDRELFDALALTVGDVVEDAYGNPAIVTRVSGEGRFVRVDIEQLVGSDRGRRTSATVKDGKVVRLIPGTPRCEWAQGMKTPRTCTTCGKPAGAPHRRHDAAGRITEGCVDAFHTGHLVTPSASADWHARPEARKIRSATAARLAS